VALFQPLTSPATLPPKGTSRESGTFDFKGSADPTNARELAKDVAAFANAFGGVVLVGAVEDQATHTLKEYSGMKRPVADALTAAYDQAVRDRCDPPPIFDALPIELPPALGTGYVVAVNVRATALGPVGVRSDKGESFAFPLRTATHTKYIKPTELSMLMVPEIRRLAILLETIPQKQRPRVRFVGIRGQMIDTQQLTLVGVDEYLTSVLIAPSERLAAAGKISGIPLDKVVSIYRHDETDWTVELGGCVEVRGERIWFFRNT